MLRFRTRDVLWIMLVAAFGVGWWAEHQRAMGLETSGQRLSESLAKAEAQIEAHDEARRESLWEIERRVSDNLVHFPPLSEQLLGKSVLEKLQEFTRKQRAKANQPPPDTEPNP